jgi:transcriptional regulator with XRE-family HTH domain
MHIKAIFGSNLKFYRKQRKLSQEQLAEELGITSKHLSTIETGTTFVSAELLEKLTEKLNVSASALFYSVEEKSIDNSFLNKVDQIIEKEFLKTAIAIKLELRRSENL